VTQLNISSNFTVKLRHPPSAKPQKGHLSPKVKTPTLQKPTSSKPSDWDFRKCCRLPLKCDGTRAETRFRLSTKRTSAFKSAGGVSSVDYWQASCTHQPAGFVLLVQACVLQSRDVSWLPATFYCFPFTSPPVRHRAPSHFQLDSTYRGTKVRSACQNLTPSSKPSNPVPQMSSRIIWPL
jgi:hypothetical protein